ncbi:MAG: hypothetical protein AB7G68_15500 [Nitrospiraceae bacterium]
MSHFLFVAGALRERSSMESAEHQLSAGVWGLCTGLIRDNLEKFLTPQSHGLVYVLKTGICADFRIVSGVQPYAALDDLLKDELRTEARYGFVRLEVLSRYASSAGQSQALMQSVLNVPDQAELTRRLTLGMHRLTEEEYRALLSGLSPVTEQPMLS